MCNGGVCNVFAFEYYSVRHSLGVGLVGSADVSTVVVWLFVEVPAVDCMVVPFCVCVVLFMNEYGASHRVKGNSVVVEWSKHFRIG